MCGLAGDYLAIAPNHQLGTDRPAGLLSGWLDRPTFMSTPLETLEMFMSAILTQPTASIRQLAGFRSDSHVCVCDTVCDALRQHESQQPARRQRVVVVVATELWLTG